MRKGTETYDDVWRCRFRFSHGKRRRFGRHPPSAPSVRPSTRLRACFGSPLARREGGKVPSAELVGAKAPTFVARPLTRSRRHQSQLDQPPKGTADSGVGNTSAPARPEAGPLARPQIGRWDGPEAEPPFPLCSARTLRSVLGPLQLRARCARAGCREPLTTTAEDVERW